jgi:hypothetical protein
MGVFDAMSGVAKAGIKKNPISALKSGMNQSGMGKASAIGAALASPPTLQQNQKMNKGLGLGIGPSLGMMRPQSVPNQPMMPQQTQIPDNTAQSGGGPDGTLVPPNQVQSPGAMNPMLQAGAGLAPSFAPRPQQPLQRAARPEWMMGRPGLM